ncbi:hypothetical protein CONPUDRAFT_169990 [Coniophora puteana RWD-64-598 SS2]|uniref:Uncharacterized protein n=1 Tax=Coniophora puteana (strain RWD-64-598) TaxID=741705 RepID=R7SFI6_CONPW|nr:uncharacterized protein CONPUDRAFT_169990 [Coniophora puteana RWD-64-598 SS2]EIW74635.1 hypothetical protein CONPUDRAFT_169990 [Coniophora puteana RWD-64-598 SS2]
MSTRLLREQPSKQLDEVKRIAGGGTVAVIAQSLAVQAEKGVGDVAKLLANEAHTFVATIPTSSLRYSKLVMTLAGFRTWQLKKVRVHSFYRNNPNLVSGISIGIGITLVAPPASVILLGSSIYGPYTCGVFSLLQHTGALAAVDVAALVGGAALIGVGVALKINHDNCNYDAQSKGRVGMGLVDVAAGSAAAMRIAAQIRGSQIISALQRTPAMEMVGAGGGKV